MKQFHIVIFLFFVVLHFGCMNKQSFMDLESGQLTEKEEMFIQNAITGAFGNYMMNTLEKKFGEGVEINHSYFNKNGKIYKTNNNLEVILGIGQSEFLIKNQEGTKVWTCYLIGIKHPTDSFFNIIKEEHLERLSTPPNLTTIKLNNDNYIIEVSNGEAIKIKK